MMVITSDNAQAQISAVLRTCMNMQPRSVETAPLSESSKNAGFPASPPEPKSLAEAGLSDGEVEALVLKTLSQIGNSTGGQIAQEICLPRSLTSETLGRLRDDLLVAIKNSSGVSDYAYQLTEAGAARARQHAARCNYIGAAPVPLSVYVEAIRKQSIQNTRLQIVKLQAAFSNLMLRTDLLN